MSNPLVLLIEDDHHLCDTISDLLEFLDINCMVARDDMTTRANLAKLKPDTVLLGMPLRTHNTLDILTDISLDFRLRHTKVMLIVTDEYADGLEYRLADAVLTKPFAVGELETMLCRLLGIDRNSDITPSGINAVLQASSAQG